MTFSPPSSFSPLALTNRHALSFLQSSISYPVKIWPSRHSSFWNLEFTLHELSLGSMIKLFSYFKQSLCSFDFSLHPFHLKIWKVNQVHQLILVMKMLSSRIKAW
ncbi:uncharacterized protein LOC120259950 [Dioscorea cayenensis subsp. rotundata]|uniref:Uncharacterized protein LOC120259950 n=1 Tax=Dioscorea cayennensis subsp. rotundata TaxID=55577 RepID=A0AB40B7U6_DIOCR|nr:uncharacterized protein LOC120259950 [Dioscorea cayenensis subsp. rotundata]